MRIESITLHTESRCNIDCIYCYTKERRNGKVSLTMDDFKKKIMEAKKLGAKKVHLIGPGEPLLTKNLDELIEFVSSLNMKTHVFTNGTLLKPELIDFLIKNNVDLTLKMHALSKKGYDCLAGIKTSFEWKDYVFRYKGKTEKIEIPSFLAYLLEKKYHNKKSTINLSNVFDRPFSLMNYLKRPSLRLETIIASKNVDDIILLAKLSNVLKIPILIETLIGIDTDNLKPNTKESKKLREGVTKILGKKFTKNQKSNCHFNHNPVIFEDGAISNCLSVPTQIKIGKDENLEHAFAKVLKGFKRFQEKKNVFRSCYGREMLKKVKK